MHESAKPPSPFEEVLDALEGMIEQHFIQYEPGELGHAFMSSNEDAARVLVEYMPRRWKHTPTGVRRIEAP